MKREAKYLQDALRLFQDRLGDPTFSTLPRLLLLRSIVSKRPASAATENLVCATVAHISESLRQGAKNTAYRDTRGLLILLTALKSLEVLGHELWADALAPYMADLKATRDYYMKGGLKAGWEINIFLARYCPDQLGAPFHLIDAAVLRENTGNKADVLLAPPIADRDTVVRYFELVIARISEERRLQHLEQLLSRKAESGRSYQLLVTYLLIQQIEDVRRTPEATGDDFDLAAAHSVLARQLVETNSQEEFVLIAQTIHFLLAQRPRSMDQWNIELTLSNVAVICATISPRPLTSPRVFTWLCRLVQVVVARYRRRLYGRSHLLVAVLQALLTCLVARPESRGKAKLYTRLLTLVCEPVTTTHGRADRSVLESERHEAKRYAGQHMYMVLMQYVKLLVEQHVPLEVREALEPGVHSILDVTTQDGVRIMSDAMNPSGRAVLKELYKHYEKFGKWTGV